MLINNCEQLLIDDFGDFKDKQWFGKSDKPANANKKIHSYENNQNNHFKKCREK